MAQSSVPQSSVPPNLPVFEVNHG